MNGVDLSKTWTAQLGVSGLYGPNATGLGRPHLDLRRRLGAQVAPLDCDRGWPFVRIEGEVMRARATRRTRSSAAREPVPDGEDCEDVLDLGARRSRDWGMYVQALWGFRPTAGRPGSATSTRPASGVYAHRRRLRRRARTTRSATTAHRISPLLVFHPSEFSRIRLQYNYDRRGVLDATTRTHTRVARARVPARPPPGAQLLGDAMET